MKLGTRYLAVYRIKITPSLERFFVHAGRTTSRGVFHKKSISHWIKLVRAQLIILLVVELNHPDSDAS
jgi:hypothetical protein